MTFDAGQVPTAEQLNLIASPPRFKGSITASTRCLASANLVYPVVEDSRGGWAAGPGHYVVPVDGLYLVTFAIKWNGSTPATAVAQRIHLNALVARYGPANDNTIPYGGGEVSGLVRCVVGDKIAAQVDTAFTTSADGADRDNNFLAILRVSD